MNTRKEPGKVLMTGRDVPMAELASNLGNQLRRFVVDATDLPGHYDFVLNWDPDQTTDTQGLQSLQRYASNSVCASKPVGAQCKCS